MRGDVDESPRPRRPTASSARRARRGAAASAGAGESGGIDRECATVPGVPVAFGAGEGCPELECMSGESGGGGVIDVDADPPPSAASSSIRRLWIAAHQMGAVGFVLGKRKAACPPRIVGQAARAAISKRVGAGSVRVGTPTSGEWDRWLGVLRVCLPGHEPGLLDCPLLQFLEWGHEPARYLRFFCMSSPRLCRR